ncbi:hypothetical protein ABTZ99_13475 [Actinosynnema sp. NPDC002837]
MTDIHPDLIRQWAQPLFDQAGGQAPWPGTQEWADLPDNHPDKHAAVVYAALMWAVTQAQRAEVLEHLEQATVKQTAEVMSAMWRARHALTVPYAELRRRRAVVPTTRTIDPDAVRRWVATGHSEPPAQENAA